MRQWIREHGPVPIKDLPAQVAATTIASETSIPGVDDGCSELYACSTCTIPVRCGNFAKGLRLEIFELDGPAPLQVVAAIKGDVQGQSGVAVRLHSECFTGDVLRSAKCDCGLQLEKFFSVLAHEPCGVLLYVKGHEGRGIGLAAKFDAYRLQEEENLDTVDSNVKLGFKADLRSYDGISQIVAKLGIESVRFFTNNPEKIEAMKKVVPTTLEPLRTKPLASNQAYLQTKEDRMAHLSTMDRKARSENIEWPRFGSYEGFNVTIVATAWNKECGAPLVAGCEEELLAANCKVTIVEVPGALDLVAGCRTAAKREVPPQAVVALGTYVRGDTDSSHIQYQATVSSLQELNVQSAVLVITGVSFYNSLEDATKRSTTELGSEYAKSALQMLSVCAS